MDVGDGYMIGKQNFDIVDSNGKHHEQNYKTTQYPVLSASEIKAAHKKELADMKNSGKSNNVGPLVNKPATSRQLKILNKGASYLSKTFAGLGWEYAGFGFQPQDGTGAYLMWTSLGDSGRVGDLLQANDNYQTGVLNGTVINSGQTKWVTGYQNRKTYYTYQPQLLGLCIM